MSADMLNAPCEESLQALINLITSISVTVFEVRPPPGVTHTTAPIQVVHLVGGSRQLGIRTRDVINLALWGNSYHNSLEYAEIPLIPCEDRDIPGFYPGRVYFEVQVSIC